MSPSQMIGYKSMHANSFDQTLSFLLPWVRRLPLRPRRLPSRVKCLPEKAMTTSGNDRILNSSAYDQLRQSSC